MWKQGSKKKKRKEIKGVLLDVVCFEKAKCISRLREVREELHWCPPLETQMNRKEPLTAHFLKHKTQKK